MVDEVEGEREVCASEGKGRACEGGKKLRLSMRLRKKSRGRREPAKETEGRLKLQQKLEGGADVGEGAFKWCKWSSKVM